MIAGCRYFVSCKPGYMEQQHRLVIKGMVCQRCISTVKNVLDKAGFATKDIQLGEITLSGVFQAADHLRVEEQLKPFGFSLVEDKREKLAAQVKKLLKEVYSGDYDFPVYFRFPKLMADKVGLEYDKISAAFSDTEKITVEQYLIEYRTEKVKEFLVYTGDTLADIAYKLNFSSVAHLSRQFKAQTGLTPSHFRSIHQRKATSSLQS